MSKQSKRHMGAKIKSTEGVDAITVADDGKVGIGTDSPDAALTVYDVSQTALSITRDVDVLTSGQAGVYLDMGAREGATATPGARVAGVLTSNADDGYLSISARSNNALTTRMEINKSGITAYNGVMNPFIRTYSATFDIAPSAPAGTTYDLFSNGLAYLDIGIIAFFQASHSSRSHGLWQGTFGGYGNYLVRAQTEQNGIFTLESVSTGTGYAKLRLKQTSNSPASGGSVSITIIILGPNPVSLHNGSVS